MKQQSVQWVGMWLVAIVMTSGSWLLGPSAAMADEKGNVVFFRGGYAGTTSDRSGELFTDANSVTGVRNGGDSGYYVGAGLDLMLSKYAWGLMQGISVLGEIGVEFKRFNSHATINSGNLGVAGSCAVPPGLALCVTNTTLRTEQITMLTVDVSPKIKFNQFGNLVPWIIPAGMDFHVISPPSGQTQYLDVGVQFGAGVEYQVWKEFKVGADARFHLASNQTNTVNNFFTVGPYVGIGF